MILRSINPYNNEILGEFREFSHDETYKAIDQSIISFESWKNTSFDHRRQMMLKTAELLRNNLEKYARTITREMGKPISEARKEVLKCAWVCEYYASEAEGFLKQEVIATDADLSYVRYDPLGTILGIMPWNFPFWQVFRFAVPSIMAGNTVLVKHASNVQGCAGHIEKIFQESGFPGGTYINLVLTSAHIKTVIEHPSVKAVSLTGSEQAGQYVAEAAGKLIKKTVLELGGNNAFIVLNDANLERAAEAGIQARMQNAGQSCIAAKRFLVHRDVADQYISLMLHRLHKLKMGDPLDEKTDIGPLSNVQQASMVKDQVDRSLRMGGKLITGGKQDHAFFSPTLVLDVKPGMPLFDEEVFGPVIPVSIVHDSDEAVKLANKSVFGLGVSVFTRNMDLARRLVGEFGDGAVFINDLVKSDPRLPFGGTKRSGYGRDLAANGIREFVNVKTVYIKNM